MAFGGVAEDGGLPGPWLADPREGSSLWGWSGDEETLPLILPEEEPQETQIPVKGLTGPWTMEHSNPFVGSLWTALRPGLGEQEPLKVVTHNVPVDVQINAEPVGKFTTSRSLLKVTDPLNNEPSQGAFELCGPTRVTRTFEHLYEAAV